MRSTTVLRGHAVGKKVVKGVALVTREPLGFNNAVDPSTGCVIEPGHELYGQNIAHRVLVFPVGKGSTAGSFVLYELADRGLAPCAIINSRSDPVTVTGCIMGNIPLVHRCDKDPLEHIRTGDPVEVNPKEGTVIVTRTGE